MPTRIEEHDDDGMSEILSRALRKETEKTGSKLDHLLAAADELGISHEAVKEAEIEYRVEKQRNAELRAFRADARRGFRAHLSAYVIVNVFLIGINLLTFHEDREIWFPYALLGWGIGIGFHALAALRKPDWNDPEFQKWRRQQLDRTPPSSLPGP